MIMWKRVGEEVSFQKLTTKFTMKAQRTLLNCELRAKLRVLRG